jgi:hypothetical protein
VKVTRVFQLIGRGLAGGVQVLDQARQAATVEDEMAQIALAVFFVFGKDGARFVRGLRRQLEDEVDLFDHAAQPLGDGIESGPGRVLIRV